MNKLNEGILDFNKIDVKKSSGTDKIRPNYKVKKIDKTSINNNQVNSILPDFPVNNSEIIIPETIENIKHENLVSSLKNKTLSELKLQEIQKNNLIRVNNIPVDIKQQIIQQIQQQNQFDNNSIQDLIEIPEKDINIQLVNNYQEITNEILPDNINLVEEIQDIQDIASVTPGMENLDITDFDFEITNTVKGKGWTKSKKSLKSEVGSKELNKIAENVKKSTDNLVNSRKVDLRGIGNLNKKLLSIKSNYRLYPINYSFGSPKDSVYGSKKGTTIVLSFSLDFNLTNRLLIFIQESRSKFIIEINCDIDFISKIITNYYIVGFEATKARLKNIQNNPLFSVMDALALTRKYLVQPIYDDENTFESLKITTKIHKHQWLILYLYEKALKGTYQIRFESKVNKEFSETLNTKIASQLTIELMCSDKFDKALEEKFSTFDWSTRDGMSEDDEDNRHDYLFDKLTYKFLKKAFNEIYENSIEYIETGIFIKEVLSKLDTKKDINSKYDAEIIIGKTNYIDYFILTYSAEKIIGGDKRHGRDYITTEKYYEENLIAEKSRLPYQERNKTVLKKQNIDRNYNSREYIFTLQYSIQKEIKTIQSKDFEEIKKLSGFLTNNPK